MFIVIEKHGGPKYATIVTDEEGNNKVFDSWSDASDEYQNCQDGLIIDLNPKQKKT